MIHISVPRLLKRGQEPRCLTTVLKTVTSSSQSNLVFYNGDRNAFPARMQTGISNAAAEYCTKISIYVMHL